MSIDTTFHPIGSSQAIASGVPAQLNSGQSGQLGVTTFRIVNTTAASAATRVSWGATATLAAVPAAPGPNNAFLLPNEALYLELPPNVFFNVAAAGTIEITGGIGGVGG